jgi:hypothetical protein
MLRCKHVTIVVGRMLILAVIVAMANTGRADAASGIDPFQTSLNGSMPPGTEGLNLSFTVPAGKTLVIEYVSGNCFVPAGQTCVLSLLTEVNGATTGTQFNVQTDGVGAFGGGKVLWRAGQQVLLYADGGKTVTLRADRNSATGSATPIVMTLSGHLQ